MLAAHTASYQLPCMHAPHRLIDTAPFLPLAGQICVQWAWRTEALAVEGTGSSVLITRRTTPRASDPAALQTGLVQFEGAGHPQGQVQARARVPRARWGLLQQPILLMSEKTPHTTLL